MKRKPRGLDDEALRKAHPPSDLDDSAESDDIPPLPRHRPWKPPERKIHVA